jgi:hypothetical protein
VDRLLGRRSGNRNQGKHRARNGWQVVEEHFEFPVGPCRQRGLDPLVEFVSVKPPVRCRGLKPLHRVIAIFVRYA